jgi:excisionase family DNA binding protein
MARYFDVDEISEYLHMSKSTIYKGTMSHRIPHIKAGKKLLFSQDAIDQWLQKFNQPTVEEVASDINSLLKTQKHGR